MFDLGTEWWQIIIRTAAIYLFILAALRATGWRSLGQRNALDLVLILVVANSVQNAMIGSDTSLIGGMIAAATLFVLDQALDRLRGRSRTSFGFFGETPVVLVNHGLVIDQAMHHAGVSLDELEEIMREHGFDRISQVKMAVLEMDGTVSIVPVNAHVTRTARQVKARHKSSVERDS